MRRAEGATKGREVPCPEDACLFWEPGGQAFAGRCVLHGIDFAHEPGLAPWLLELRDSAAHGSASAASEGRERDDR